MKAGGHQFDLFAKGLDLLEDQPAQAYRADPDKVRAELFKMLAEACAASTMPWERKTAKLYQTIFPQMSNWLPQEEAAQLRLAFAGEMERLKGV